MSALKVSGTHKPVCMEALRIFFTKLHPRRLYAQPNVVSGLQYHFSFLAKSKSLAITRNKTSEASHPT